ncbi:MAG: hypothetical protein IJS94_03085, partial [Clostridia bacterium]|nr:hypothetical protein [Clostridia bacterium]
NAVFKALQGDKNAYSLASYSETETEREYEYKIGLLYLDLVYKNGEPVKIVIPTLAAIDVISLSEGWPDGLPDEIPEDYQVDLLSKLRKDYPEYFYVEGNGIDVFVWQSGDDEYSCCIAGKADIDYPVGYLSSLPVFSIDEAKLILDYNDPSYEDVSVYPFNNPKCDYSAPQGALNADVLRSLFIIDFDYHSESYGWFPEYPWYPEDPGTTDTKRLKFLKETYPYYFGLDVSKGLEVYAERVGEDLFQCVLSAGPLISKSESEIKALKPVSNDDIKLIVSTYGIPEENVLVCVVYSYDYNIFLDGFSKASAEIKTVFGDGYDYCSALFDGEFDINDYREQTDGYYGDENIGKIVNEKDLSEKGKEFLMKKYGDKISADTEALVSYDVNKKAWKLTLVDVSGLKYPAYLIVNTSGKVLASWNSLY